MGGLDRFKRNAGRRLRADATDMERKLWHHLWRIPVHGTHFRRQVPIGPYIVDFASHSLRLVIELDGSQHGTAAHRQRDRTRDRWLAENRYRVLRFWNEEVKFELNAVLDTIHAAVVQQASAELSAQPPPGGEVAP